ncbi:hypothetical protein Hanom_Chr14g01247221 [Helianthus anomalus]
MGKNFRKIQLEMLSTREQQQYHQLMDGSLLALEDTLQLWQPHGAYNALGTDLAVTDQLTGQTFSCLSKTGAPAQNVKLGSTCINNE